MSSSNKSTQQARAKSLLAGLTKHLANAASLAFGSATYTPSSLGQLIQSYLDLESAVVAAKASYVTALAKQRAQAPALLAIIRDFRAFVLLLFSKQPDVLSDFGVSPRKVPTPTPVDKKVRAVQLRLATREARHTMGKKQRLAIEGSLAEPAVAAPAPSPMHAQAASPSNGGSPQGGGASIVTPVKA